MMTDTQFAEGLEIDSAFGELRPICATSPAGKSKPGNHTTGIMRTTREKKEIPKWTLNHREQTDGYQKGGGWGDG